MYYVLFPVKKNKFIIADLKQKNNTSPKTSE